MYFTLRTQNTAWPEWMGIVHAADLELLFGQPIYQRQNFNDQDREICMKFMNRIKSFVETGLVMTQEVKVINYYYV